MSLPPWLQLSPGEIGTDFLMMEFSIPVFVIGGLRAKMTATEFVVPSSDQLFEVLHVLSITGDSNNRRCQFGTISAACR